jgi:hypothetical protein
MHALHDCWAVSGLLVLIGVAGCGEVDRGPLAAPAAGEGLSAATAVSGTASASQLGVYRPRPIQPAVRISDATFIAHAYRVLLARQYERAGMRHHLQLLESGKLDRSALFEGFVRSSEFAARQLGDRHAFVRRLYEVLLHRPPAQVEVDTWVGRLRTAAGEGSGLSWYEAYGAFIAAPEFAQRNCHDRATTTTVSRSPRGSQRWRTSFAGTPHSLRSRSRRPVALQLSSTQLAGVWDQKLADVCRPGDQRATRLHPRLPWMTTASTSS